MKLVTLKKKNTGLFIFSGFYRFFSLSSYICLALQNLVRFSKKGAIWVFLLSLSLLCKHLCCVYTRKNKSCYPLFDFKLCLWHSAILPAKCLLTVPGTSCMEQKSPLTQANWCPLLPGCLGRWVVTLVIRHPEHCKLLPSSVFVSPCLDQGDMETFGSTRK